MAETLPPLWAPDTTPQDAKKAGWRLAGYTEDERMRPIWEETVDVLVGKAPLVVNGEPQFIKANGEVVKPRLRNIYEKQTRRFIEVKTRDGGKFKNYNFQPDPEEKARVARKRQIAEVQASLAEKLVERGLSVDALLDAVSGEPAKTGRGRKAAE